MNDGEEAKWLIPLNKENNWIDSFKNNLSFFARWDLKFTNIRVFTSHDITFQAKIGQTIKDELLKEIRKI